MPLSQLPRVLVIAGHDPSGAGIHADIETCAAMGCCATTVISALTVQNTHEVRAVHAVDPAIIRAQIECALADDRPIVACKIGLLPDLSVMEIVSQMIAKYFQTIPVVLDPVIKASVETRLISAELQTAMGTLLIPKASIITPNLSEAYALTGTADVLAAAKKLDRLGCELSLVTGVEESHQHVVHHLYRNGQLEDAFTWPRLPENYHGSGCTLASAIAAELANGEEMNTAIINAQRFTWESLRDSRESGFRQVLPNRIYRR